MSVHGFYKMKISWVNQEPVTSFYTNKFLFLPIGSSVRMPDFVVSGSFLIRFLVFFVVVLEIMDFLVLILVLLDFEVHGWGALNLEIRSSLPHLTHVSSFKSSIIQ